MTQLDIDAQEHRRDTGIISKADRYALLKMLDEKPRVIIDSALRDAARRGMFTDKMLDHAPYQSSSASSSFLRRLLKSIMLTGLLLILGVLAYVGLREYTTLFQESRSLMGITPDDVAKAAAKAGDEKDQIVYARLSEPIRNALKNYVPETNRNANADKNCTTVDKQAAADSSSAKTPSTQRPTEPADRWIERMTVMNKAGKTNELQTELKKFRQAYPGVALPRDLQAFAC
jgi:hypothetical protein